MVKQQENCESNNAIPKCNKKNINKNNQVNRQ